MTDGKGPYKQKSFSKSRKFINSQVFIHPNSDMCLLHLSSILQPKSNLSKTKWSLTRQKYLKMKWIALKTAIKIRGIRKIQSPCQVILYSHYLRLQCMKATFCFFIMLEWLEWKTWTFSHPRNLDLSEFRSLFLSLLLFPFEARYLWSFTCFSTIFHTKHLD